MKDVMTDLETLGQVPGAIIVSVGAVAFDRDTGKMDIGHYRVWSWRDGEALGLHKSADTMAWWQKQSPEAQAVLKASSRKDAMSVKDGLEALNRYIKDMAGIDARVWGNGSDFDNALLAAAYRAAGVKPGWKFWNSRCFRTINDVDIDMEHRCASIKRQGTHHNALDDARHQARCAIAFFGSEPQG